MPLQAKYWWTERGVEYEADPRQAERIIEELGLQECKGVATPAVRHSIEQINADTPLEEAMVTRFRAIAARSNHPAADRSECKFSTKEICSFMAQPTKMSVDALKRLGRYLLKHQTRNGEPLHPRVPHGRRRTPTLVRG